MGPPIQDIAIISRRSTMGTTAMIVLGIFLFGTVAIIGYFIMIYNGLISLKENIKKSWSNIDVILKQRHDELPKLISVCESFAEFEKGVIEQLVKARQNYMGARGVAKKAEASGQITAALGGLFAIAENYPDLKANENFMQLQTRISHLEESSNKFLMAFLPWAFRNRVPVPAKCFWRILAVSFFHLFSFQRNHSPRS